jgi:hypothetical protein
VLAVAQRLCQRCWHPRRLNDSRLWQDCDADNDVVASHHYLNHSAAQGVADVLHAGTDVDCGGFVGKNAQAALDGKTITEADMDER